MALCGAESTSLWLTSKVGPWHVAQGAWCVAPLRGEPLLSAGQPAPPRGLTGGRLVGELCSDMQGEGGTAPAVRGRFLGHPGSVRPGRGPRAELSRARAAPSAGSVDGRWSERARPRRESGDVTGCAGASWPGGLLDRREHRGLEPERSGQRPELRAAERGWAFADGDPEGLGAAVGRAAPRQPEQAPGGLSPFSPGSRHVPQPRGSLCQEVGCRALIGFLGLQPPARVSDRNRGRR